MKTKIFGHYLKIDHGRLVVNTGKIPKLYDSRDKDRVNALKRLAVLFARIVHAYDNSMVGYLAF